MDVLTKEQRSHCMTSVRATNTAPEMIVRRIVFRMGFRYRLHYKKLPGKPDIVFPSLKKIIFIHGCFWHRHRCKKGQSLPQSNKVFWNDKLTRNIERDRQNRRTLKKLGWQVLVVWECQTKSASKLAKLEKQLQDFLTR